MPTDLGQPFAETQMFLNVSSGRKFFLELMISMRTTCRGPTLDCRIWSQFLMDFYTSLKNLTCLVFIASTQAFVD